MPPTPRARTFLRSNEHYYDDGDVLVTVEATEFRVHKVILAAASPFFNDLFTNAKPGSHDLVVFKTQPRTIDSVLVPDECAEAFTTFLSVIYWKTTVPITAENVSDIMKLADKFLAKGVFKYCELFLVSIVYSRYLLVFELADRYKLAALYKESSKLILDNVDTETFHKLAVSGETLLKLYASRVAFLERVMSFIAKDFPSVDYTNLQKFLKSCPRQKPSEACRMFHEFFGMSSESLHHEFVKLFGCYERVGANGRWCNFITLEG